MRRRLALLVSLTVLAVLFLGTSVAQGELAGTMSLDGGAFVATSAEVGILSDVPGATIMTVEVGMEGGGYGYWGEYTYAPIRPVTLSMSHEGTQAVRVTYRDDHGGSLVLIDTILVDFHDQPNDMDTEGYGVPALPIGTDGEVSARGSICPIGDPDDVFRLSADIHDTPWNSWLFAGGRVEATLTAPPGTVLRVFRTSSGGVASSVPVTTSVDQGGVQRLVFDVPESEVDYDYHFDIHAGTTGGVWTLETWCPLHYRVQPSPLIVYALKGRDPAPRYIELRKPTVLAGQLEGTTASEGASWLSVSQPAWNMSRGTFSARVTIASARLYAGAYRTTIRTTVSNALNSPVDLPVTLYVLRPSVVRLAASTTVVAPDGYVKYTVDARRAAVWSSTAPRDPYATIQVIRSYAGETYVERTIKTDRYGRATFYAKAPTGEPSAGRSAVRVRRVRGSGYYDAYSSWRYVSIRWKPILWTEATSAIKGTYVTFRIAVYPLLSSAGRTCQLQEYKDGGWRLSRSIRLDDGGRYEWSFTDPDGGKHKLRVYMPAGNGFVAGYSPTRTVTWY